jgi:hypothetical protein
MKSRAFLVSGIALFFVAASCGHVVNPGGQKVVQRGSLNDWAKDPNNYDYFYYSEDVQPTPGNDPSFRFLVNDNPVPLNTPSTAPDKLLYSRFIIALQKKSNAYMIFYREYVSCLREQNQPNTPEVPPANDGTGDAANSGNTPNRSNLASSAPQAPGQTRHQLPPGAVANQPIALPGHAPVSVPVASPAPAPSKSVLVAAGTLTGNWKIDEKGQLVLQTTDSSGKVFPLANATKRQAGSRDVIVGINFVSDVKSAGLKGKPADFTMHAARQKFGEISDHDTGGHKWQVYTLQQANDQLKDTCAPVEIPAGATPGSSAQPGASSGMDPWNNGVTSAN